MTVQLSRRSLITGLVSLVASPAIMRVANIMPVKAMTAWEDPEAGITNFGVTMEQMLRRRIADAESVLEENIKTLIFGDRYVGISGSSNKIYFSDQFPLRIDGVEIQFDVLCPPDTFYLMPEPGR